MIGKRKILKPITLITAIALAIGCLFALLPNKDNARALENPTWINDNEVGISFNETELDTTYDTSANEDTVTVIIACGVPSTVRMNEVKVKIRTRNATAVAGVDYTAFDGVVSLRRSNSWNGVCFDTISIKVNKNVERFVVDGVKPYFEIELYEVLTAGFKIKSDAKLLVVNLTSVADKLHTYLTNNELGHRILGEYAGSTYGNYDGLKIYHENKSGQTLNASQTFKDKDGGIIGRDYLDTGFANLYAGGYCKLDESGVTMPSWCTLKLYDGSTSGTQVYTVRLRHIDYDALYFGQSYGDMLHEDEAFATDYVFKSKGNLNWGDYYYMNFQSRTIYETFKSDSNWYRETYDWNLNWIPVDESTPKIKGWYVDQSTVRKGDKIRISVRFNEPINVAATDVPNIRLRTKLSGAGGFNNYSATFTCVSKVQTQGHCSDTLVFEFDPSKALDAYGDPLIGTINNIEVEGFDNIDKVCDYGRNREDENNRCKSYATLSALEADKCAPRQVKSSLTLSFDNRSPVVEDSADIPSEYVSSFKTQVTASGTSNMEGVYYLWSTAPDLNYARVVDPESADLEDYYELDGTEFRKTTDIEIDEEKNYFVKKEGDEAINLARVYELERNYRALIPEYLYSLMWYRYLTPYQIGYSANGVIETELQRDSGTYYLYVFAKSTYSDENSTMRRFGPVRVDAAPPELDEMTIDGTVQEKNVSAKIKDLSGVKTVVLYLSEKYLECGKPDKVLTVFERNADGTLSDPNDFGVQFTDGVLTFKIYADTHVGLKDAEGEKSFGDYYVGLTATDVVGNVSEMLASETSETFDMRAVFAPTVKIGGETVTDDTADRNVIFDKTTFYAENAYVVDISSGPVKIVIGHPGKSDPTGGYRLDKANKIEKNTRIGLRPYDDNSIGQNEIKYFTDYLVDDKNGNDAEISFFATTVGFYEFTTIATLGEDTSYSKTQRFYVTDGNQNSEVGNYGKIFGVGVNLKNEVFALGSARFYSRTGPGMGSSVSAYYNDSVETLAFSSRDKAADYVRTMEYKDLYAVRLTEADVTAFSNGVLSVEREESRKPAKGDVWIRYKSTTWNFSTAQRDWTYYYLGGAEKSVQLDVNALPPRLVSVIDKVVSIIIGNGSVMYLNSMNGTNEGGALYLDPARVPQAFTADKSYDGTTELTYGGDGENPLVYTFDSDIFYDKYNDRDDATLISSYTFEYINTTKLYYAPAQFDEEGKVVLTMDAYKNAFKLLATPYLTQSATESGVYVIRELDENGLRDYAVYVDKDTPSILTQYKDLDGVNHNNVWLNQDSEGEILHTTQFNIQFIEDKKFSSDLSYDDYHENGVDADTFSYVAVFNITSGEKVLEDEFSLKDLAAESQSYDLPYGIFLLEVYDRAGNCFTMTVSRAEKPLDTRIEVTENDNVTYIIPDRLPSEIDSVYVSRPGRAAELVDFAEEAVTFTDDYGKTHYGLVYTDAGRYEFTVTDKYGYTISPANDPDVGKGHSLATLTRVNPYETVKWVTRTDDGKFVDLDENDVNLFRTDNYYITSDDKLSFVLDSTTVYSYAFTGNVKATPIQRTINGKTYIYVNVDSSERWSVKIYYTLYPDICVTYNRIAKKSVVPAAINLRPSDKDSKGVAQADLTNRIVVYVGTQDEIIEPITVTLRTRDRSAIAALGDYDAFESEVTLTPSVKEQMVVIQTHPSGFSTYNSVTYEYGNRTFDLFIDSIEGNGEKGKATLECACPGSQELNITVKDGLQVFDEYLKGAKFGLPNVAFEKLYSNTQTNRYQEKTADFSINPTWMSTFVNTGIADVYVGAKLSLSASDISEYKPLRLTLSETSSNSQLFRVYINEIEENKNVVFGSSYDGGLKVTDETYDKDRSIVLSEMRGVASAGRYFLMPNGAKGNFRFNVYEEEGMYITYVSAGQGGSYPVYNYVVPARNVNDAVASGLLIDSKAPTVESWHIDHNTIRVGENLRLSLRFSEPVYISGKAPVITANVASALTSIDFTYAGGAGTDTLYFEFDPSAYGGEVNADAISLISVTNFGSICDYGYNASKRNNYAATPTLPKNTEWDPSCSLDTRLPVIDLDVNYLIPSTPQRTASVPIAISKTTAGAKMEYAWTIESAAPAAYEKSLTLTGSQQKVNIEAKDLSGTYYLHVYMKSVYGKVSTKTFGPFLFDNTPPNVTNLMVEEATKGLRERNVVFYVGDEPYGSASAGIAQIYVYYSFKGGEPQTKLLYDRNQDEKKNLVKIPENNRVTLLLSYEDLGIKKEEQKDVTLAFYAVDGLGNVVNMSGYTFCPTTVNFDARSEVEVAMTCSKSEFFNADGTPVYNVRDGYPRFDFAFSRQADEYDIREMYINGNKIAEDKYADYADYYSDAFGVHITFKNTVFGFIRVNFKAITGLKDNQTVQESSDVTLYLTSGSDAAETANYKNTQSGTLLINKVYMLDTSVYYYHNGEGVRQLNYNDTTRLMAFSSRDKAVEFVRYYEMQDLGVLNVTSASVASSLNTGDGTYRKASADNSVMASVGQVWLRYKRATWDNATTPEAWVYYYYGTTSEIDPERLPSSLSAAIAQVTDTIVDRGGYVYLTGGNDGLDKNGSPYLHESQIALERLTSFITKTGADMRSAVNYSGDPDIYDSQIVTSAGETCSLVTTYQFEYGEYTKIFYTNQTDADGNPIVKEFKLLPAGTVFGSLNIDGGVYWLRECDESGMRDYKVFLDKTAPTVNVSYENARGDTVTRELDSSIDGTTVNGKTLRVTGFSTTATELDSMAYIAVFKKNGVLVNVYRQEDIPRTGVEISDGQYFLEISDRSGNVYRVNVSMNSTPMTVKVNVEENRRIQITCNRDATEIKNFEIYLDGKLIESNYSSNLTYYQAGVYSIRIEDWFGNTFTYDYELKRELPKINWNYVENEEYFAYDGTQSCLRISKTGEREYQIVTNKALMFTFDTQAGYEYEFDDKSLAYTVKEFNGFTRVRIHDALDWTLTVRYARYPEIYVVYNCVTDMAAPIINVTARQDVIKYFDMQQLEKLNGTLDPDLEHYAEFFTPDNIYFEVSKTVPKAVRENSTIFSPLITLQFTDKSICNHVEVYLDGVMIREFSENEGVSNITVTRFGEYRIVARDALGNESEFCFINDKSDGAEFYADGKELAPKISPAESIVFENDEYSYPSDAYAYESLEMAYDSSATIAIAVEKNGEKKYLRFESINGALYQVAYMLMPLTDEQGNPVYDGNGDEVYSYRQIYAATIISDVATAEKDKTYVLATAQEAGVDVYVRFDEEERMYYRIDAPKDGEAIVELRVTYNEEYQPYFLKAVMCGKLPEIALEKVDDGERVIPASTDEKIYLSGGFFIAETAFDGITEITAAYSETTEFGEYQTVYTPNDGYVKIVFEDEGFYSIKVKNIYGRVAEFTVIMANELRVVVTAEYDDGETNQFLASSGQTFKANESVTVDVYFERITYVLTYNGVEQTPVQLYDPNGTCSVQWKDAGVYALKLTDGFGNEVDVSFEIKDQPFAFKQDYLIGYNEKALRKDEGYTNNKLSVNADRMIDDGVYEVKIIYGEEEYVVFDVLKTNGVPLSEDRLNGVIGRFGDGEYVLKMRSAYGNVTETVLHYRETDTLSVSRTIRTSRESEPIGIAYGEVNKIYSNYSVTFETVAGRYEIRIDGNRADMPLVVAYPTDGEEAGEYVKTVTYIDEYGFEYEFEVNLVRKILEIKMSDYMDVFTVNEQTVTKGDVKIEFDSAVSCEVSRSGGERVPYTSGEVLTADGVYRFYITDVAGNVFTAMVKKDTLVEFTFINAATDRAIENGGVITEGSARFTPVNSDSAHIDLAVLNGEEYVSSTSTAFNETGKWEFIVSDDLGNRAYYYFYVVEHSLARFEYESPYAYKISSVQYDGGDGVLVSYNSSVIQNALNSRMIFSESGTYFVTVESLASAAQFGFNVAIDRTPPTAKLVGAENGGSTTKNVTLANCKSGEKIEIYKNGDLIQTTAVTSDTMRMPEIKEEGEYKIVVSNAAGNSQVFEFTREYTANFATTVTVIVVCLLIAVGLLVVLILRKRVKV